MANEWNLSYPTNDELIADLPEEHRERKTNVKAVLEKEHATLGDSNAGGQHKNGSAVCYEGTTAPTNAPDGSTALGDTATDRGRLYIDDNFDPPVLKRWDGSAVEVLGRVIVDAESIVFDMYNQKHEDTDGGRECQIRAHGEQSGGEASTLGYIEISHDGASDDQKGQIKLVVNDGDDNDAPSKEALRIQATGKIDVANSLSVLDEDDMASDDAEVLSTQQAIKYYVDNHGYVTRNVAATPTAVYTLYLTGNFGSTATTNVAHGIADSTKILHVSAMGYDDDIEKYRVGPGTYFKLSVGSTNLVFEDVNAYIRNNAYRIKVDYTL